MKKKTNRQTTIDLHRDRPKTVGREEDGRREIVVSYKRILYASKLLYTVTRKRTLQQAVVVGFWKTVAGHDSVATGRQKSNGIVKRPGETLKQRHEPEVAASGRGRGWGGRGEKGFPPNLGLKCPNLILSYTRSRLYLPTINASCVCVISRHRSFAVDRAASGAAFSHDVHALNTCENETR